MQFFFFSSRRRHTRLQGDWSSDVCSSDLHGAFELTVPVSAIDHLSGAEHAAVTLVEYGDFECPNCKQAQSAVKLLLERFDGRVRVAFRNFPLEDVHPHALAAAEAAECAGGQGKFRPMHDLLFAHQ